MELSKKQIKRIKAMLPDTNTGIKINLPIEWSTTWIERKRKESPSSIVTFLGCSLRWYIERYSPLPDSGDISAWSLGGTIAHRILEVYYSEPADKRSVRLLKDVIAVTWDAIEGGNDEDGIVNEEIINGYQKVLQQGTYSVNHQAAFIKELVTKSINNIFEFDAKPEEVDVISNETWLRTVSNGITINGKADRIVRLKNGKVSIDDWKTGNVYNDDNDEITVLDTTFLPAGMYAWMMLSMHKGDLIPPEIDSVALMYLAHLKTFRVIINEEVIATVDELINRVTKLMNKMVINGEVYATPSAKRSDTMCKYCPILDYCPAWTDNNGLEGVREAWGV